MPQLRDQPQREVRQGKGLAGAGTGLQQAKAGVQRIAVGIKTLSHQSLRKSCCRIGPYR